MDLVTRGKAKVIKLEPRMGDALTNRALTPQKWLKYELLHHYGLADLRFLGQTIHRFPRSAHIRFLTRLRSAMMSTLKDRIDTLFVVKFVPMHLGMMLPNVRLTDVDDLKRVKRAIEEESSNFEELWFCQTRMSPSGLSVAGRVAINGRGPTGHVVEQVWRCSPRMIEDLGPHFRYPFVRAHRVGWRWSSIIDEVHIPRGVPETKATLLHELGIALGTLDEQRDKLELMSDAIATLGLDVCFEYKLEGSRLQIIDWDTSNDLLVIRKLLPR